MRRPLLSLALFLSAALSAHADIVYTATPSTTTSPNGLMSTQAGVSTITFNNSLVLPTGFVGGQVVNGNTPNGYATPNGDTSNYYVVGGPPNFTGTSTFNPGGTYTYFGLYWGSIDAYNTLTFLLNGAVVGSVTGSMIPPANGSQTAANTNEYVNVSFTNGSAYNQVQFTTTAANFEIDNVAFGNLTTPPAATPEPSGIVLLGTGLLGLAGLVKRRLA